MPETPELLRDFAGRGGWLVAKTPSWYAHQAFQLFDSSVTLHLVPVVSTSLEDWTFEVIDSSHGARRQFVHGDRARCVREADKALTHLNTVLELRNLGKRERIEAALDGLPAWGLEVARRDLGVPYSVGADQVKTSIVDRIINPPRA